MHISDFLGGGDSGETVHCDIAAPFILNISKKKNVNSLVFIDFIS